MKKDNPLGFSLIELLVVVAIIAILTVIGIAVFGNVSKNARDAKRKADVEAIVKALENQFDPESGKYPNTLEDGFFTADKKPEKPEGGNYDISWTGTKTNHTGFKVCAALDDGSTQYCKQSSQGKFVAVADPPPDDDPPWASCPNFNHNVAADGSQKCRYSGLKRINSTVPPDNPPPDIYIKCSDLSFELDCASFTCSLGSTGLLPWIRYYKSSDQITSDQEIQFDQCVNKTVNVYLHN